MANESSPDQKATIDAGNMPLNDTKDSSRFSSEHIKEYGRKSFEPLMGLIQNYKGDFTPYVDAVSKGLRGAANSFSSPNSEAERAVSGIFTEACDYFDKMKSKLQSENKSDLMDFLEDEASKRPGVMFASSYVVGLVFGRLGRHLVRLKARGELSGQGTVH